MLKFVFTCLCLALLVSCNSKENADPPEDVYLYSQPPASLCDEVLALDNGFLCAIRPSNLDPDAKDAFGTTGLDAALGFGYHAIAFPNASFNPQNAYVHFTGSYGRPYNQNAGSFSSKVFLEESLSSGYIVIQPAYHNRYPVNSAEECGAGSAGSATNNCAGAVRLEKLTGTDQSSIVTVDLADGIEPRLVAILEYFEENGFIFPGTLRTNETVNWNQLRVGGHSQGAGQALYIGKNLGAQNVCIIGGAYDSPDSVPTVPSENLADWLLTSNFAIEKTKIKGFLTQEDDSYNGFSNTLTYLGVGFDDISSPPYSDEEGNTIDGHSAPMHDPRFASERSAACFD